MIFNTENIKENTIMMECKETQGCMICSRPTKFLEVCCEGRLCSTECSDAFYKMVEDQERFNYGVDDEFQ